MSLKKKFLKSKPICKVTFSLPKEATYGSNAVLLLGDFNNWDKKQGIPMKLRKGEFTATVDLPSGAEYQFRYLVDEENWENDWAADRYVTSPYGIENSVVSVYEKAEALKEEQF